MSRLPIPVATYRVGLSLLFLIFNGCVFLNMLQFSILLIKGCEPFSGEVQTGIVPLLALMTVIDSGVVEN